MDSRILAWARDRLKTLDVGRLEKEVREFLGPHNRLHSPDEMARVEQQLLTAFATAGLRADRWPYDLRDVDGAEDFGWGLPTTYPRLAGVNLVAARPGFSSPDEAIVILAHYDTRRDTPGADDNTASVVAILEMARLFANVRFHRSVILVLTDMEELLCVGARALIPELRDRWRVLGVYVLETLAFTTSKPHTLKLESRPGRLYRAQWERMARFGWAARFSIALYQRRSRHLAALFGAGMAALAGPETYVLAREPADLPLLGPLFRLIARNLVRQFRRSDHVPFWKAKIPAIMITDGADFANPHYHQASDLPETLDYARLSHVIGAVGCAVAVSAGMEI